MKALLSAAFAVTMIATSPTLAATPTPQPVATVENFHVEFKKIAIEKAIAIYPGDKATLVAVVKGTAKTLKFDAYIDEIKLDWSRKFANVSGEVTAKFVVPSNLQVGNLRFEVLGVSKSGQKSSDEDVFLSAGPQPVPGTTTPVAPATPRHSDALAMALKDANAKSDTNPPANAAKKGATTDISGIPKFEFEVTHNSAPIISKSQTNNFTTSSFKVEFANGMVAGLKALNAPEDQNANPDGQSGYVPFVGWQGAATKDVNVELVLGAHLPVAGATSSHPLELGISFFGNPGWEPLTHHVSLHTDLAAPSIVYNNALRVAGDEKGLHLNAISGTSHAWEGGYRPQLWLGAEIAGPISLLGADAALGVAYDIPMPTSGASFGDGIRAWFVLSQF